MRFVFDESLCMGCWACEVACKQWHGRSALERGNRGVRITESGEFPNVERTFQSVPLFGCNYCKDIGGEPRCALTCPTGALSIEE